MINQNLDITKVLTVSTAHIKMETYEALSLDGEINKIQLPVYTKSAGNNGENYGLFIYLVPECLNWNNIPDDLVPIIKLAMSNECGILCLDSDGMELNGFQIYDW